MANKTMGVGVFLFRAGNADILVGKRGPAARWGAGLYCLPGGMVEDGESLLDAAVREVREEAGMFPTLDDYERSSRILHLTDHFGSSPNHYTTWLTGYVGHQSPQVREPDKIGEWEWWPMTRFEALASAYDRKHPQYHWLPMPDLMGWLAEFLLRRPRIYYPRVADMFPQRSAMT